MLLRIANHKHSFHYQDTGKLGKSIMSLKKSEQVQFALRSPNGLFDFLLKRCWLKKSYLWQNEKLFCIGITVCFSAIWKKNTVNRNYSCQNCREMKFSYRPVPSQFWSHLIVLKDLDVMTACKIYLVFQIIAELQ